MKECIVLHFGIKNQNKKNITYIQEYFYLYISRYTTDNIFIDIFAKLQKFYFYIICI